MSKIITYKGHTIQLSNTTTNTQIYLFGKLVNVIKKVYQIDGKLTTNTSVAECKRQINGE